MVPHSSTHHRVHLTFHLPAAYLPPRPNLLLLRPPPLFPRLHSRDLLRLYKGVRHINFGKITGAVPASALHSIVAPSRSASTPPYSNTARPDTHRANLQLEPNQLPSTPFRGISLLLRSLATRTMHLTSQLVLASTHTSIAGSVGLMQARAARCGFGASLGLTDEW